MPIHTDQEHASKHESASGKESGQAYAAGTSGLITRTNHKTSGQKELQDAINGSQKIHQQKHIQDQVNSHPKAHPSRQSSAVSDQRKTAQTTFEKVGKQDPIDHFKTGMEVISKMSIDEVKAQYDPVQKQKEQNTRDESSSGPTLGSNAHQPIQGVWKEFKSGPEFGLIKWEQTKQDDKYGYALVDGWYKAKLDFRTYWAIKLTEAEIKAIETGEDQVEEKESAPSSGGKKTMAQIIAENRRKRAQQSGWKTVKPEQFGDNKDHSTPGEKGYLEIKTPLKAATKAEYLAKVAKGKKNLVKFAAALEQSEGKDVDNAADFERQYVTSAYGKTKDGKVTVASEQGASNNAADRYRAPYVNEVAGWGETLVASQNRKDLDQKSREALSMGARGVMSNSDVLFHQYRLAKSMMKASKKKPLKHVIRNNVAEKTTRPIMEYIKNTEEKQSVTCLEGTNHFLAILGTPNGSGVLWMVKDHGTELGVEGILKIVIDGGNIIMYLKPKT